MLAAVSVLDDIRALPSAESATTRRVSALLLVPPELLGPPLDQGHARPLMPKEVDREQGARETGADNHDMIGIGGEKQVGLGHRRPD